VFGNGRATLSGYVPLGAKPTLALRVGGERAFGSFPIQDAALLGGRFDLRGYRWDRYSGDTSLFGNAEVRAPLTRITLLVRGDLGAIALADIGRVWMDGASDGDWHHSFGGGLSFSSLSKAVSVVWAHGEENRVYLNLGLPF
jgi:hemolysin activation/secretion protein